MADFLIVDENKKVDPSQQVGSDSRSTLQKIDDFLLSFQKIKIKEKAIFYRLLSTMTNAWMWVMKSVQVLANQEKNKVF